MLKAQGVKKTFFPGSVNEKRALRGVDQMCIRDRLQGTQEMLDRRLESERATQRMQAAQAARTEPKLGEIKPQAPAAGFNVATAYVDEESQAQPASVGGTSAETLSGKLITARTYMGVGAYEMCIRDSR